jgi:hypothetical protein
MKTSIVAATAAMLTLGLTLALGQEPVSTDRSIRIYARAGSYEKADLQELEKNFLGSLDHPVDGVVEAALGEIARVKLVQPLCCSEAIVEKLHELAIEGRTSAIRYKAALTSILFENPGMFENERPVDYPNGDALFTAIARRLEKQVLTMDIR